MVGLFLEADRVYGLEEETMRWTILLVSISRWTRPTSASSTAKAWFVHEGKSASMAQSVADELVKAPSCRRIVFETRRMVPILFL
jgi:hypothetical protein